MLFAGLCRHLTSPEFSKLPDGAGAAPGIVIICEGQNLNLPFVNSLQDFSPLGYLRSAWAESESETKDPWAHFISGFEGFLGRPVQLECAPLSKARLDATDLNLKKARCVDDPGHAVVDRQIVRTTS